MIASPPYVVVDASVSLKWALPDEDSTVQAAALRHAAIEGRLTMIAPTLWVYETTSGLVVAVRRGRLSNGQGQRALEGLLSIGLELAEPNSTDVYARALSLGIGANDATYVALADALDATLWTGDLRLYGRVRGTDASIAWIGDFAG